MSVGAFLATLVVVGLWIFGNDDNAETPIRGARPDSNPEEDVADCPDYSGPNDARLNADEIAPMIDSAASALLASNNQEHQLAAMAPRREWRCGDCSYCAASTILMRAVPMRLKRRQSRLMPGTE